ncbi:Glycosyl transferase family 1 domain-containing protein [Vibrio crassostreae]|nr:Glycosyl transferase family 1 domain-containing protein [Vibrio crassostreae]CAK2313378.1 Glycosyl transferase family 1 domain-containing protein [Vibrio crassostreae]CAK2451855.1 Glycosyl transferase family 1 domain-containing protein [Vibrio crassostreae]CAK2768707.1 Glycosyl transferase family 1 domain-containing protein [Vibrio crassostreae]
MKLVIYRRKIFTSSGAGQLIVMQAKRLKKLGKTFELTCQKGWGTLWFKHLQIAKKAKVVNDRLVVKEPQNTAIIDHEGSLRNADLTFIHNVPLTNIEHDENSYTGWLRQSENHVFTPSQCAKNVMVHLGVPDDRISVIHPGYNHQKFNLETKTQYRDSAIKALKLEGYKKVIGFITSGNFEKRGLKEFLDICQKVAEERDDIAFFVLGAKRIPKELSQHPTLSLKQFRYKPSNSKPEFWLSSLDIFVYPAKLEEFGMVVAEALAMGTPVITTQNVGAHEILSEEFEDWINPSVDVDWFSERILQLAENSDTYQSLVEAARKSSAYDDIDYATRSLAAIDKHLVKH